MSIAARTEPMTDAQVHELAAAAQALSDPIRTKMLSMMSVGRGCCPLPESPDPGAEDDEYGLCVCDFEEYFGMAQSKVSYHMRKLKDAGLVREQRLGRWNYYSVNRDTVARMTGYLRSLDSRT